MVFANKYITKMSIRLNDSESVTGAISGSIMGLIAYGTFSELLITGAVAIGTGFLGALGSHLFKVIREKIKQRKNG